MFQLFCFILVFFCLIITSFELILFYYDCFKYLFNIIFSFDYFLSITNRSFSANIFYSISVLFWLKRVSLFVLCFSLAEVQAHSSQQSRAEMDQLREQLIDAFRQQMDIRRHLMELENNNMEIQIDTSKHLLTITEWVFILHTNQSKYTRWPQAIWTQKTITHTHEHYHQLFYHFRLNKLSFK